MDKSAAHQPRRLVFWLLASCLAASAGCSAVSNCRDWARNGFKVGPEYCKPAAPVAPAWIDEDDQRVNSNTAQTADWWLTFGDPVLNDLVQTSYSQNLTLREAGTRVLQARAQRGGVIKPSGMNGRPLGAGGENDFRHKRYVACVRLHRPMQPTLDWYARRCSSPKRVMALLPRRGGDALISSLRGQTHADCSEKRPFWERPSGLWFVS
jgi:hypothetical protein